MQKYNYDPSYRSYLATMRRKRSDALFEWLKELYIKSLFEGKIVPKQIKNIADGTETKNFGTWLGESATSVKFNTCPDSQSIV